MPPSPPPDPPAWVAPAPPDLPAPPYLRARRVTISGLFLGWAGPGLAIGGTVAGLGGAPSVGLEPRRVVEVSLVGGAGLSIVGLGLQAAGSAWTRDQFATAGLPTHPGRRALAWGLAATGAVSAGYLTWRILEPEPDGLWLPIGGGVALAGTLGATVLHLGLQADADNLVHEATPRARLRWAPDGVHLEGRF